VLGVAARYGHFELVQRMVLQEKYSLTSSLVFESAIQSGNLPTVQWMVQHRCRWQHDFYDTASLRDHCHIMDWAQSEYGHRIQDAPNIEDIWMTAAEAGSINVLMWWEEHDEDGRYEDLCDSASLHGQFETVEWLHTILEYPMGESTLANAARNGNMELIEWLHRRGCALSPLVCRNAAENGHLEVLEWARSHSCPWNPTECLKWAKSQEHWEVVKFIRREIESM